MDPRLNGVILDSRLVRGTTPNASTFDAARNRIRRGGTDDDSLGGGVAFKGKGYDVVNERLVGPETSPARVALRDAIWQRLETPSYLLESRPAKAVDVKRLGQALSEVASARQAASLAKQAQTSGAAAANLADFVANTRGVSKDTRASLLQTLSAQASGVSGAVVAGITGSEAFAAMSHAERAQLATVLSRLDDPGLAVLGSMVERTPEALKSTDSAGHTLLSNLAALASQPLHASLAGHTSTEELLEGVLTDVMNPNRIEQGTAATCTVASMQFELVADEPAEYARLMAGLAGASGVVKMRGGGDLRLGPGDADPRGRSGRSASQALFQSAAMEYANGRFANYDPVLGVTVDARRGQERLGLKPADQQALLEKLFGVKYSIDRLFSEAEGAKALERLQGWDATGARNRPIVVDLDQGKFNHAVTLESVTRERVTFRDPYGVLRSMPASTFPKVAVAVHLPTDVKRNGVG
ncbi:MAG: hypothetical protein INH37_14210 [Myxococcaceae bacterium]|nr:hypothetical protein [Myxococcaceae bacterium]